MFGGQIEKQLLKKYNIPDRWADCTVDDDEKYMKLVLPKVFSKLFTNQGNFEETTSVKGSTVAFAKLDNSFSILESFK